VFTFDAWTTTRASCPVVSYALSPTDGVGWYTADLDPSVRTVTISSTDNEHAYHPSADSQVWTMTLTGSMLEGKTTAATFTVTLTQDCSNQVIAASNNPSALNEMVGLPVSTDSVDEFSKGAEPFCFLQYQVLYLSGGFGDTFAEGIVRTMPNTATNLLATNITTIEFSTNLNKYETKVNSDPYVLKWCARNRDVTSEVCQTFTLDVDANCAIESVVPLPLATQLYKVYDPDQNFDGTGIPDFTPTLATCPITSYDVEQYDPVTSTWGLCDTALFKWTTGYLNPSNTF